MVVWPRGWKVPRGQSDLNGLPFYAGSNSYLQRLERVVHNGERLEYCESLGEYDGEKIAVRRRHWFT